MLNYLIELKPNEDRNNLIKISAASEKWDQVQLAFCVVFIARIELEVCYDDGFNHERIMNFDPLPLHLVVINNSSNSRKWYAYLSTPLHSSLFTTRLLVNVSRLEIMWNSVCKMDSIHLCYHWLLFTSNIHESLHLLFPKWYIYLWTIC